jgi:protein-tyrosine phosphatase
MYDSKDQGFDQVNALAQWVNICRETAPVLVHCQAGLNRSSLVAARAIHLHSQAPGAEVVRHLRERRSPAALCNPAFEAEVESWK